MVDDRCRYAITTVVVVYHISGSVRVDVASYNESVELLVTFPFPLSPTAVHLRHKASRRPHLLWGCGEEPRTGCGVDGKEGGESFQASDTLCVD